MLRGLRDTVLLMATLLAGMAVQPVVATAGAKGAIQSQPNRKLTAIPQNTWEKVAGFAPASTGILAYSGGVYDSIHHQFLIFGGGHADYWGNEVCAFSPATLTWKRMYEPDAQARYTNGNIDNTKTQWQKVQVKGRHKGLAASGAVWNRLHYDPVDNVVLLVVDSGVWAYKPPRQVSGTLGQ